MPRLQYSAPGVYVEEVPSARQPIAGVGTNTVGFIGIVPNKIWIPVQNPKYDPVKAQAAAKEAAKQAQAAAIEAAKQVEPKRQELEARIAKAQADLDKAKKDREALPAEADAPTKTAAARKVTDAEKALDDAKKEQVRLDQPAAAAEAVDELGAYSEHEPAAELQEPSELRPYYLKPFDVQVAEFDTKLCTNFTEYTTLFGDFSGFGEAKTTKAEAAGGTFGPLHPGHHLLTHAVSGFFRNGGTRCFVARVPSGSVGALQKALQQFESIDDVAILCAPGLPKAPEIWEELESYCEHQDRMNVFAILDSPAVVGSPKELNIELLKYDSTPNLLPRVSTRAAYYFPHIEVSDPAKRLQDEDPMRGIEAKYRGLTYVAPSGHVAGIYARVDEERGVHKAPANAVVRGALEVKYYVSKTKQELLNPQGVNCIRFMGGTIAVWGARTIGGDRNGEWKYVNVRRLAGYLEESIDEGTQWVVFEPNDPSLWSKIRLNVSAFLTNVWRNGALFGTTPEEAFYVKCDEELNPPEVRDLGQVITEIGVAIVRPAEFVIFRISQVTGGQKA